MTVPTRTLIAVNFVLAVVLGCTAALAFLPSTPDRDVARRVAETAPIGVREPARMADAYAMPIFTPARTLPPATDNGASASVLSSPPPVLAALLRRGGGGLVVLRATSGPQTILRVGETHEGWRLLMLRRGGADFVNGVQHVFVPLVVESSGSPPQQPETLSPPATLSDPLAAPAPETPSAEPTTLPNTDDQN